MSFRPRSGRHRPAFDMAARRRPADERTAGCRRSCAPGSPCRTSASTPGGSSGTAPSAGPGQRGYLRPRCRPVQVPGIRLAAGAIGSRRRPISVMHYHRPAVMRSDRFQQLLAEILRVVADTVLGVTRYSPARGLRSWLSVSLRHLAAGDLHRDLLLRIRLALRVQREGPSRHAPWRRHQVGLWPAAAGLRAAQPVSKASVNAANTFTRAPRVAACYVRRPRRSRDRGVPRSSSKT
jgi:hypothetical protein